MDNKFLKPEFWDDSASRERFRNQQHIGGRGRSVRDTADGLMSEIYDAYRYGGPYAVYELIHSKREQPHKAPPRRHPMQNDENYYSGVCVGGPRDGASVTCGTPVYTVSERREPIYTKEIPTPTAAETSGYDYVALTPQIGVWVHEDLRERGVSLSDAAISRLLGKYGDDDA